MSLPAFSQLFSRYINMKQDADLRITDRGRAEAEWWKRHKREIK